MSYVKGSKISSKMVFVREYYGDAAVDRVLKMLSLADRAELRLVLDGGWYPFELYGRVLRAACEAVGGAEEEICLKIGAHSAELALEQVYRAFRAKDPVSLLNKMAPMHALLNDPGEMEVVSEAPGRCTIIVKQPISTETICKVARGFYLRSVELCGGHNVRVNEAKCSGRGDRFCEFKISWQARSVADNEAITEKGSRQSEPSQNPP